MSYLEHYVVYFYVAKLITSEIQDLQVHLDGVIISTLINKCRKKEEDRRRRRWGRKGRVKAI